MLAANSLSMQAPLLPYSARPAVRLPFTAASRTASRQVCACQRRSADADSAATSPVHRAMQAAGTMLSAVAVSAVFLTGGACAEGIATDA